MVSELLHDSLGDVFQEYGMHHIEGLDKAQLSGLTFQASVSPDKVGVDEIIIHEIRIPSLYSENLSYQFGEYMIDASQVNAAGVLIKDLAIGISQKEQEMLQSLSIGQIHMPSLSLGQLYVHDVTGVLGFLQEPSLEEIAIFDLQTGEKGTSVGKVSAKLAQKQGGHVGKARIGKHKGLFNLDSMDIEYEQHETEGEASKHELSVNLALNQFKLPNLYFGKRGEDDLIIRTIDSIASKGRGATFNGARAKLIILVEGGEKKVMLSEFHAQSILAANIKLEYNGNAYQLRGDHVFENFQITGMQYDLTNQDLESGTLNWENWQGQELWHNMHMLKGVETGKGMIERVYKVDLETHEKVGGYAFDIQGLEMNQGAYQDVELDEEKNKTKHHQIEVQADGKSNINGVYYEDEELYFNFQMPEGELNLPFVHYEDGSGNIIRTLDRYPVTLENPRVKLLKKKDGTIILRRMNIDQLTARGLKASLNGNELKIPSTEYASIEDIHAEELAINLDDFSLKGHFSTGEADLSKAMIAVADKLEATPTLQWKSLSFRGDTSGEFEVEVDSVKGGLEKGHDPRQSTYHHRLSVKNDDSHLWWTASQTHIFDADKITVLQTKDDDNAIQKIIVTNPTLGDITLGAEHFKDEVPIKFRDMKLGGQATGDLVIENRPDGISVYCWGDNQITLKEGEIILPQEEEEKEKSNKAIEEMYPDNSGDFDFLNSANGTIIVNLFDDGHFELPIVDGYIKLNPFLSEIGEYYQEKTWGRADWILGYLETGVVQSDDEIINKKYQIYYLGRSGSVIQKLINNPNEDNNLDNLLAKLSAIVETQITEIKRLKEFKKRGGKIQGAEPGSKEEWFENGVQGEIDDWMNDTENPLNLRVKILLNDFNDIVKLNEDTDFNIMGKDKTLNIDFNLVQESGSWIPCLSNITIPGFVLNTNNSSINASEMLIKKMELRPANIKFSDIQLSNLGIETKK